MISKKVVAFATWFGCGDSPMAPGTVGSLGAVPVHLALRSLSPVAHTAIIAAVTVAGIWASDEYAADREEDDPQEVVIDEVAGTLIAMGLVRNHSVAVQVAALVLFRALDIVKPGPIRTAEKAKPAGLGIMLDDLAAGLIAGVVTRWVR